MRLIKHTRNQRRLNYGKALLRMFVKKPKVALQSILRDAERISDPQVLPTNFSVIRDESFDRIFPDQEAVISQV
jgi:hypothetical protein